MSGCSRQYRKALECKCVVKAEPLKMLWIVTDSATQKKLFNLVAAEAVILLRPHGNKLYDGMIEWP